ncbi:MAG: hypothetical protein UW88_C0004G0023 [Candidatus Collierbacteria bacterium GW2011_GWD2_45_10]|uniref:Uncharacterized protein n=1 Tax=Candidatus Collierbacteria bacterium GW2011_GWB2_44_22 TaxID=1618387 RepID=A0A0G1HYM0_9BACT|nr:MAG: hypothetical protein UW31_C0007G0021 [Candidatus Collierbacteria bacterium GW2011_GWA2_44_13]KKT50292.1 MAG: hypothetical protein UW42_C0021G0011 [Candidatus Collierbacteria bacterium GW2011_GWB1_44_197]KKT52251.1 MAG: hypothetical protein UW44_C0003G0094 [Candidatus Collierbacteria bacterium GW2011_GWB2_44_22]KKT63171.1 MAG: hypothetical protein UW56_C0001G0008 [Candidatus Collierbacteria bacterium GW2011_GWD1_44_27]KKT66080.1 MAG: hypothetical protein UW58_C0013G0008 [Candidatus Colli
MPRRLCKSIKLWIDIRKSRGTIKATRTLHKDLWKNYSYFYDGVYHIDCQNWQLVLYHLLIGLSTGNHEGVI